MAEPGKPAPGNMIGVQLQQRRKGRKLSRARLAAACGLHPDTIEKAEKGSGARPLWVIEQMAACLGLRLVLLDDADLVVVTDALRKKRAADATERAAAVGARAPLAILRGPGSEDAR